MSLPSQATHVIGISAHYHDAACCLLRDGELVAAAEEERFTRRKHDPSIPKAAFNYCLREGGIEIQDVDVIAYYEQPEKKLARQIYMITQGLPLDSRTLARLDPLRPERDIREILGHEGPIQAFTHHHSHAASAFYFSGFEEAAILTVDGVGEWETTTYGRGSNAGISFFEAVEYPDSLGLLYSTITGYLGFEVNEGEYKVMGLAPYGKPRYADKVRALVTSLPRGQYRLNLDYFNFNSPEQMHTENLVDLFGQRERRPDDNIQDFHKDVARSLQIVLEEVLLEKTRFLHAETGAENLCMAGGVALNCVANARLLREGPFRQLFVQPASSDAGGCLGAAAMAFHQLKGKAPLCRKMTDVYLGPRYSTSDIANLVESAGLRNKDYRGREGELLEDVAHHLGSEKVVGWFHGRMEFGPRALGARSILADPRNPEMRERINALVKMREAFRPFAPAVLSSRAADHFDLDHSSPFMTETCQVISQISLPAITHVDGSARVQTVDEAASPRFAALLRAFEKHTGCPILLNTSLNVKGEPIVCSPIDALVCFIRSGIDILVLEDFVIERSALGAASQILFRTTNVSQKPTVSHRSYTLL
jgi:carbamoyltransferase